MATHISRSIRLAIRPLMGEASTSRLPNSMMRLHSSARMMAEESITQKKVEQTSADTSANNAPPISVLSMPTLTPGQALPESFRASQTSQSPSTSSISLPGSSSSRRRSVPHSSLERRLPHKLHVQATRNNCIVTLTTPEGTVMKRESSGSIGFKKAARSGYEAAYRVAMTMFQHIETNQVAWRLSSLEVVWKGLGQGREAVYRAMLSNEGTEVRNLVKRISDNTAIKVGGTRPKKRRML